MSLDRTKLENIVELDGKITARCPTCQEDGHDNTGNHLVVYDNESFGCVVHPGCSEHRRRIYGLVGRRGGLRNKKEFKCKLWPLRVKGDY